MPATSSVRLRGLDTLRALAILIVMLYHLADHLPESWGPVAQYGWIGVDLFFVLSGYLIGAQLLRPVHRGERPDLRVFYRRRAFRILPAYLTVLALYLFVPCWRESPGMAPAWQFLTFTENLQVDYAHYKAFSNVWSLCVEEHFYLLLPLLVLWWARKPTGTRVVWAGIAVLLLGIAARSFVLVHWLRPIGADSDEFGHTYLDHMYYPSYTRLDGLLFGVALAWLQLFRPGFWDRLLRWGNRLAVAGLALGGGALWLLAPRSVSVTGRGAVGDVLGYPLLDLGLAFLVAAALAPQSLLSRWRIPGTQITATLAFSLYLLHKPVAHLDVLYGGRFAVDGSVSAVVLLGTTSFAAAALLYFGVERPFLRWRDRVPSRFVPLTRVARIDPAL